MTNNVLFYDCETTGVPVWKSPSDDPRQPHLVQLAAILVDLDDIDLETAPRMCEVVRPDGWEIPEETIEVHGITEEAAMEAGLSEDLVLRAFLELWRQADLRVGHNEQFDARVIRIGTKRYFDEAVQKEWHAGAKACTARLAAPIVRQPPTEKQLARGRFKYKTPSLAEAYEFFKGIPMEGAHNAMADTLACFDVYIDVMSYLAEEAKSNA